MDTKCYGQKASEGESAKKAYSQMTYSTVEHVLVFVAGPQLQCLRSQKMERKKEDPAEAAP